MAVLHGILQPLLLEHGFLNISENHGSYRKFESTLVLQKTGVRAYLEKHDWSTDDDNGPKQAVSSKIGTFTKEEKIESSKE